MVLPPPPTLSLNSIAYRRVICVYQYQVADDLSGRSTSFQALFWFLLLFLTHAVPSRLCNLMHCSLKTPCGALVFSVPSCCTNLHSVLTQPTHQAAVSTAFSQWTGYLSPCLLGLLSVLQGMETATYCLLLYTDTQREVVFYATFSELWFHWVFVGTFLHVCIDFRVHSPCIFWLIYMNSQCSAAVSSPVCSSPNLAWFGLPLCGSKDCIIVKWR